MTQCVNPDRATHAWNAIKGSTRMGKDWSGAAYLVGRISVWLGLALVLVGLAKTTILYVQSHRGLETLATIESTAGRGFGTGGWVDLSWRDAAGATRQAAGVPVTSGLGRKLRLGSALARSHLRIRYQPNTERPSILVIEDVPEQIKSAAALSIAGFLAITAGSLLVLAMMLSGRAFGSVALPDDRRVTTNAPAADRAQ